MIPTGSCTPCFNGVKIYVSNDQVYKWCFGSELTDSEAATTNVVLDLKMRLNDGSPLVGGASRFPPFLPKVRQRQN
jgi:hypothetical protein